MVKPVYRKRLIGNNTIPLPQDLIVLFLSDQRLQFVVADHLRKVHFVADFEGKPKCDALQMLQHLFSEEEIIRRSYLNTDLVLCHNQCLIQPKRLSEQATALTEYFLRPSTKSSIITDDIDCLEASNLFEIDISLKANAEQVLTNLSFHHLHTLLIDWSHSLIMNLPGDRVFGFFGHEQLSILYFKDCKLHYVNRFDIKAQSDCVYYILLIYKQFGISTTEGSLTLHGMHIETHTAISAHIEQIQVLQSEGSNRELDPYWPLISSVANHWNSNTIQS